MKKSFIIGSAAILLSLGSLTSCNNRTADANSTIYFWHTFGQGIQRVVDRLATEFEQIILEEEGVTLDIVPEYQGGYDELSEKIVSGFPTGNTPTITVAYPDNVASYLYYEPTKGDYVVNLEDFINDSEVGLDKEEYLNPNSLGVSDFVPSFFEEGQNYIYEGTYSLPYMKSTELMLYNRNIVAQVLIDMGIQTGVEAYMRNITWEQFMEVLNYVNQNKARYGLEDEGEYPLFYDSDANLFISQMYQRNIPYLSMDGNKGQVLFNNDEAKAFVNEIKAMHDEGILLTKGTNNNEYGSNFFKNANCLFCVGSTGGSAYSDPGQSFEVGVCKFPVYTSAVGTEYAKYVSQGVTLALLRNPGDNASVNDFKTTYGWKFMKFLTNTQNSIDACLGSAGYIPARYSSYEDEYYQEYLAETDYMSVCANIIINDIDGEYFNYPVFMGSDVARDQVGGIITNVLAGNYTVEESFKQAYENTIRAMN